MDPRHAGALLVGESPAICQIRRQIEKLAHTRTAVLLLGESGAAYGE